MQQIIDLIFYMLDKFWNFIFSLYILDGVSIGMLCICSLIFSLLVKNIVVISKAIPGYRRNYYDVYKSNDYGGYDHHRHTYK